MLTVRDIGVKGKRVLVRADLNVPLDEGKLVITDDSRIRATLPTIRYLIEQGARVVLCSHLGRPKGKVVDRYRLAPVGRRLSELLGGDVSVTEDCIGPAAEAAVRKIGPGGVVLLENLRFHPEEEANDPEFARALARLADVYVNDAFGASHRAHASIVGVAGYLPAVAGLLVEKEVRVLEGLLTNPAHPFAQLAGGAKVSDKIAVLKNTLDRVDYVLVGGGMAATFLKARSYDVGLSLVEDDALGFATSLIEEAPRRGVSLLLPVDVVVADTLTEPADIRQVSVASIPPGYRIADIGPQTVNIFSEALRHCQTIFWNGPMGVFEIADFARGTREMAQLLAGLKATTVVGGGSTAESVAEMKLDDRMTFVSTGGGASLRFLGGEMLPGLAALRQRKE